MKADVLNKAGQIVDSVELDENIFGIVPNEYVVHQAVVAYLANQRQGTQSAKTKAEVSGSGKKPWRQKGTGRARVGYKRNPVWYHGGVAFAPKPRDYTQKLNKKMRRLAMHSVFSDKAQNGALCIIDELRFDAPKTKDMIAILSALKLDNTLIVIDENDMAVRKSISNLPNACCTLVGTLNVYEMLKYDQLLLTRAALAKIQEVYC